MTPDKLLAARARLGMTQVQLARALKLGNGGARTVRRWEAGDRAISGPVEVAVRMMLERGRPEMLEIRPSAVAVKASPDWRPWCGHERFVVFTDRPYVYCSVCMDCRSGPDGHFLERDI